MLRPTVSLRKVLSERCRCGRAKHIPEFDFNGVARTGTNPEVGAYEWDGFDNPGWAVQEGFKSFDLNYATNNEVLGGGCCRTDDKTAEAALVLPLLCLAAYRRREEHF